MKKYDYLLVGSGLYAAVFAWMAGKHGKRCLVIEKREHIGGNIYCEETEGIRVHQYGAHIFHTSNREVWDFVNQFTEFNRYTNSPVANYNGEMYNMPFNMNTFSKMWGISKPEEAKAIIEEQKKAVRAGYDMDIIPSDLATYGAEAKKLLQDLQSRNERMFLATFLVLNTADNPRQLGNNIFQASSIAQKYNCQLTRLDFQQEEGLMSSLPLGLNQIEIQRGLTTSSTAIFVPFTTQELFQNGKEALYYGINALSNNLIMVDRKLLKNPNGLILGTPGSGKSFSAKREIANCFLLTNDDIIICDPEAEYAPLVERLHGQVIKISPTSGDYINPMDLNLDYSDDESPLSLKSDFILSLCELIVGGKEGLQPVQKTIIDRCVRMVYQNYLNDPRPENMPVLEDLYDLLRTQEEKEAQYIATALEIYVTGSLNVFNHRTNVNIQNRIVCYDIKELGKQLKKIGMLVVQDQVWNRVTINRAAHKSTRYYIDEMHLLLKEEQTAAYTVEIWKRFRKWGGIPTGEQVCFLFMRLENQTTPY